mmetsp:Transcript_21952/g.45493  ORF Transcript_21952/g.45493 Transcript_21952/m.45493 type:complete len:268 (+) Transcript_21952:47-850(+)
MGRAHIPTRAQSFRARTPLSLLGLCSLRGNSRVVHEAVCVPCGGHDCGLGRERLPVALGQRPDALPRDSVQELQLPVYALRDAAVHLLGRERGWSRCALLGERHVPAPLVHEAVHGLVVGDHVGEDAPQGAVNGAEDEVVLLDAALATLCDQHASRVHLGLEHGVELGCVELVARAALERVVQVHDDDVKLGVAALKPCLCIINHQLQSLVGERRMVLFQVLTAEANNVFVNVHHDTTLHTLVPQDLPCSAALTTAANVHGLGVGMQ